MSSIYESNVDPLRPNDAHGISLQLIGRDKKVLELGAAAGHVTRALKSMGNTVVAVERDGRFAEQLAAIADRQHAAVQREFRRRTCIGQPQDLLAQELCQKNLEIWVQGQLAMLAQQNRSSVKFKQLQLL